MKNTGSIPAHRGRNDTLLVRMLLRLYARNLRRSWRNTPHNAFADALVQLEVPLAVAVVVPLALLNLLLGRTIIPALAHAAHGSIGNGAMIAVGVSMGVIWAVDRKLKSYEFVPGVESSYDTAQDRKLVYTFFVSAYFFLMLMLFAAHVINRAFPRVS